MVVAHRCNGGFSRYWKFMHKHSPDSSDRESLVHLNRAADYIQNHFAEDLSLEKKLV